MRRPSARVLADSDREHLTRVLVEQMEQAYDTEGTAGLTRLLGELFRQLDDRALRDFALGLGLVSELELDDSLEDTGPAPGTVV